MQRLRQALPYLEENGWAPTVVSVRSDLCEVDDDPLLLETIPPSVSRYESSALSASLTRRVGLGNLGFRSWFHLRSLVNRLLADQVFDLVFFSTTVFTAIAHGPHWKQRHGVPFVVDLQDPWRNDYYLSLPPADRPRKFRFDYAQKKFFEARTMPSAAGVLAVSDAYIETMHARYPVLREAPARVLPFGADILDIDVARSLPATRLPDDDRIRIRYAGRGGPDMARALAILFRTLKRGLEQDHDVFGKVVFEFVGTSYARADEGIPTVSPIAAREGVADRVSESPARLPYFEALRWLIDADILLVPGSDDPSYTASKIYPYVLVQRPLLAIFHEQSSVVEVLKRTRAGVVTTFDGEESDDHACEARVLQGLQQLIATRDEEVRTDWSGFERYTARAMTEQLCSFLDEVAARSARCNAGVQ